MNATNEPRYRSGKRRDQHVASYFRQVQSDSNTWILGHTDKDLAHPDKRTLCPSTVNKTDDH